MHAPNGPVEPELTFVEEADNHRFTKFRYTAGSTRLRITIYWEKSNAIKVEDLNGNTLHEGSLVICLLSRVYEPLREVERYMDARLVREIEGDIEGARPC